MSELYSKDKNAQKVALVTGANRGIGKAFVKKLAEENYHVVATSRSVGENLDTEKITYLEMDVTNENQIIIAAEYVKKYFGKLDLLINNAATLPGFLVENPDDKAKFNNIESFDSDSLLEMFKINSIAPMIVIKHFLPLLKLGNHTKIIQISSISGSIDLTTSGGAYAYSVSKTALNMFTKVLSIDLKPFNIITVPIHPGSVQTRLGRSTANLTPEQSVEKMLQIIDNLKLEDSGSFLDLDGNIIPW